MPDRNSGLSLNEAMACEVCGRFGAYDFGGQRLCAACYEARGSCCPEFGGDDLWEFDDSEKSNQPPEDKNSKPG